MRDEQWRNKKRRGRPRWSGEFNSGKCDVRLTSEENSMLNELADRNDVSRSDVMRKALRDLYKFNSDDENLTLRKD